MGKQVTVILDEEDLVFLEKQKEETGISVSALIRQAVKEWIRREKEE
ncbi:MAG: ribbon-helix-helix protein, CopG family [Thermoplasmata archaeon]|nr:ribbon-helix-helix protein, CopG family [Thermoplasmata archaeon]